MAISKVEAKQLLERLIFEETEPREWVDDVWGLSALHGESAAKLLDVFETLIECCSEQQLENLLQSIYQQQIKET